MVAITTHHTMNEDQIITLKLLKTSLYSQKT